MEVSTFERRRNRSRSPMPTLKLRGGIKRVPTGSPLLGARQRTSDTLSTHTAQDTGKLVYLFMH